MTDTLILASSSPQRARLLEQLGVRFAVIPANIDEAAWPNERPESLAARLAQSKAEALSAAYPAARIIGSDTVVALGGQAFGKPRDSAAARQMLSALGGTTHHVITGVALFHAGEPTVRTVVSEVTLDALSELTIARYWATGEPAAAAGGYAIQGRGGQFVAHLSGSYSAVMGLPIHETAQLLRASGLEPLAQSFS